MGKIIMPEKSYKVTKYLLITIEHKYPILLTSLKFGNFATFYFQHRISVIFTFSLTINAYSYQEP